MGNCVRRGEIALNPTQSQDGGAKQTEFEEKVRYLRGV